MIEKIDVGKFEYASTEKGREKLLFDKVNELVEDENIKKENE